MYIAQERICEGYDTYYDGIARSSNPKLEDTQAFDDWEEGWDTADSDCDDGGHIEF